MSSSRAARTPKGREEHCRSDGCQIGVGYMPDGCQIGVRIVTAQSTRHMHYTMTSRSGDCMVLVTITVTTDSYTRVSEGCQICHSSVHKTHALYNDMSKW